MPVYEVEVEENNYDSFVIKADNEEDAKEAALDEFGSGYGGADVVSCRKLSDDEAEETDIDIDVTDHEQEG